MTRARNQIISTVDTPYYHCIARCVRRAFLCGDDPYTGQNYEHRRQWVIDRLVLLEQVFCIDICAYAVMSNHYHLVLCINESAADQLTDDQVIERWTKLFRGPLSVQDYKAGKTLSKAKLAHVKDIVHAWRERLADISWFMRCLNEHIAREANKEDSCKGCFWESRFKSQALLDEKALLTCMAYVDLNPLRAAVADTPETSDFTSVQQRIIETKDNQPITSHPFLKPFDSSQTSTEGIGFELADYLSLVDYPGRAIRTDKRGYIPAHVPNILARLGIDTEHWLQAMRPKGIHLATVLGDAEHQQRYAEAHGLKYIPGSRRVSQLFH